MAYVSLLDCIESAVEGWDSGFSSLYSIMSYDGSLGDILDKLGQDLPNHSRDAEADLGNLLHVLLNTSRVIRAITDYKIEHPDIPDLDGVMQDAIELGLVIYQNSENAPELFSSFRQRLRDNEYEQLLSKELKQPIDGWEFLHPSKSKKTASALTEIFEGQDILFIALGHGGVTPGMDVYSRYCDMTGNDNSAFYTVRFSQGKKEDTQPQVTAREIEHLQSLSQGRYVVIFDEDIAGGSTLDKTHSFFSKYLGDKVITCVGNYAFGYNRFGNSPYESSVPFTYDSVTSTIDRRQPILMNSPKQRRELFKLAV